jgi:hypothetical protein
VRALSLATVVLGIGAVALVLQDRSWACGVHLGLPALGSLLVVAGARLGHQAVRMLTRLGSMVFAVMATGYALAFARDGDLSGWLRRGSRRAGLRLFFERAPPSN